MLPSARRTLSLSILALSSLGSWSCKSTEESNEVVRMIREERYEEAVQLAAERSQENPEDARARDLYRDASVALILDQGRQALFDGRLEDALEGFNEALALAPANQAVSTWILKARSELTRRWLDAALELMLAEDFDRALEAFELALYYTPEHPEGLLGASRVLFLMNYRQGMGESYYNEGVRAVYNHLLTEARGRFAYVGKYLPGDPRAEERRTEVESALARERNHLARGFEEQGLFGAAFNEYRLVMLLEPDNAEAQQGFDRMDVEVKAQRLLSEADKLVRQGRFEEAEVRLREGQSLTKLQTDEFGVLASQIDVANWERLYEAAMDAERDYRYVEAIATYEKLIEEAEFFEDADVRKATLEDYVERAEALYAELERAATPEEEERILREIHLIWPEFRDVRQRLEALGGDS
jgi:tetratricopeptide (TPR) repeat protein